MTPVCKVVRKISFGLTWTWMPCVLLLLAAALPSYGVPGVIAESHFDTGWDGWTPGFWDTTVWQSSGGNPGGFLEFPNDPSPYNEGNIIAPDAYLGNWTGLDGVAVLSYDFKVFELPFAHTAPYAVFLKGGPGDTISATWTGAIVNTTTPWVHVTAPINAGAWTVTGGTWQSLLSNVSSLKIEIELFSDGPEAEGVDNVVLAYHAPGRIGDLRSKPGRTAGSVDLTWTATGDDGAVGTAAAYDLRYSADPITADNFAAATAIAGVPVPKSAGSAESFTFTGLTPGATYYFAIKATSYLGNRGPISNTAIGRAAAVDNEPPLKVGDVNQDNAVDVVDLLYFVDSFGWNLGDSAYDPACDFNADASVDVVDLLDLVYNFGT